MAGEQVGAVVACAVIGVAIVTVGLLGRTRRIDFALGGWDKEAATPASWRDAHDVIGAYAIAAGAVLLCATPIMALGDGGWLGPGLVVAAVLAVGLLLTGVVRGLSRLEPAAR